MAFDERILVTPGVDANPTGLTYDVYGYRMGPATLAAMTEHFVARREPYYFDAVDLRDSLLEQGIAVYTQEELSRSFPTFSVEYGSLYRVWEDGLMNQSFVSQLSPEQWMGLNGRVRDEILAQQVRCGRGHVYPASWFMDWPDQISRPRRTVKVDGVEYYGLTAEDWDAYGRGTQFEWVLRWLRSENQNDEGKAMERYDDVVEPSIPVRFIKEYAGTFAKACGPNCFAAAIAAVVAQGPAHISASRSLITEWLHQGPFFRLLSAQGFAKSDEVASLEDFSRIKSSDVLVWYRGDDETATHAAYAVTANLVFQKGAQGFEHPWQVIQVADVWYNEHLLTGGRIDLYRHG